MLTDATLLRPFDSTRWVIAAPGGRNLLINEQAATLYRLLAQAASPQVALLDFNHRFEAALSLPDFWALVDTHFGGYQLLQQERQPPRPLFEPPQMRLRRELLAPRQAAALSAPLQPLYTPAVFWAGCALLAAALLAGHLCNGPTLLPTGSQLWVTLPLIYASLLIHELGHVAATGRAGIASGGIGVGLYAYLFPVLYADVTGIWLATRQQRIIANLAGIFSQLLYAAALAAGFLLTAYEPLRFAASSVSIMALWQFNPFVRHDGYWLLCDLSNTPNLLPRAQALMGRVLSRHGLQRMLASNGRALLDRRVLLLAYGLVNWAILLFFIAYTCWHNGPLVLRFPLVLADLAGKLLTGTLHFSDLHQSHLVVLTLYLVLIRQLLSRLSRYGRRAKLTARPPAAG